MLGRYDVSVAVEEG